MHHNWCQNRHATNTFLGNLNGNYIQPVGPWAYHVLKNRAALETPLHSVSHNVQQLGDGKVSGYP